MPKNGCFLLMAAMVFLLVLPGCTVVQQEAFYVSPFNGNNEDYHPLPQRTDSVHTAVYVHGSFFAGAANDKGTDYFSGGNAGIFVAHHFGLFQCYYGGDLSIGTYHLGRWDTSYTFLPFVARAIPPPTAGQLNQYAGPRTFGGTGYSAGINMFIPMGQSEWRFLGLETTAHHEFGDYLALRRKLPDSTATLIVRNPSFGTLGLTTEMTGRTGQGEFGFRLAHGWVLSSPYGQTDIYDNLSKSRLRYRYTSFSFHYSYRRYTGYMMVQTGAKASSFNTGLVYRVGRSRLPIKRHSLDRRLPPIKWR
jgi:hypothetical protein